MTGYPCDSCYYGSFLALDAAICKGCDVTTFSNYKNINEVLPMPQSDYHKGPNTINAPTVPVVRSGYDANRHAPQGYPKCASCIHVLSFGMGHPCITCDPNTNPNFAPVAETRETSLPPVPAAPYGDPEKRHPLQDAYDATTNDSKELSNSEKEATLGKHSWSGVGFYKNAPKSRGEFLEPSRLKEAALSPAHAAPYSDPENRHPLQDAYDAAIAQATGGKGVRHGGDSIPFFDQRWYHVAKSTGEGGLMFQGVKKAEEACEKEDDEAFERELLGSMVYLGMAYLYFKRHGRK